MKSARGDAEGEGRDARNELSARCALPDDLDAFLAIARLCVEETGGGKPFDEQTARYVFAGLARADPAITLLQAGAEIVGFSLMNSCRQYLTGALIAREDLVFIRADKRCAEGELRLHAFAHTWFEFVKATEAYLLLPTSEYADDVRARLLEFGYRSAGARLAYAGPVERPSTSDRMH